ncbi:helix-turn-helix domain-containing protein [soil metagenome]
MSLKATEIDAHVGRRMRQRREALGVSQGRLGRHLGLTFSQVQKYEKGSNRIGAGRLHQIGAFLGVPVQYFFEEIGGSEALPPNGRLNNRQGARQAEALAALEEAFLMIGDMETRRSVLALVKSLASSQGGRLPEQKASGQE